jgi:copper resistance protein C
VTRARARAERSWSRATTAAVLLGVVVTVTASIPPHADAHTELVEAQPAPGVRISGPVDTVRLVFAEPVVPELTEVAVTTTGDVALEVGRAAVSGPSVVVPVGRPQPAGSYVVAYRTVSSDGHVITGSFDFELERPAGSTTSVARPLSVDELAPSRDDSSSTGGTLSKAVAGVGVGVLLGATLLRRRLLRDRRG